MPDCAFVNALAAHIIAYRDRHGETIAQFAKGCGVSAATIRKLECGYANIRASTADKILRYMNITPADLLSPLSSESLVAGEKTSPTDKTSPAPPQEKSNAEKIPVSALLADIPSDQSLDQLLLELFPSNRPQTALVTRSQLEILKLCLEGLDAAQIAEQLHITYGQASNRLRKIVRQLRRYIPDNLEIDLPPLRKLLGIQPFHFTGRYTKLSELLRDMPSDEVLFRLHRERGNMAEAGHRRCVNNQDLQLLQQRLAGRTYRSIGEDLGVTPNAVRRRIWRIKAGLRRYLAVDLDVPGLFD